MEQNQGIRTTRTVLLVDDDADYLLGKKLELQAAGYTVLEAESSLKAEELIEQTKPDIAVIDLMMEEDDSGFTLCYFIKKRFPDVPVIIVTGVASETGIDFDAATREERAWIKADALLAKPVRFEQLEREIKRLMK